MCALSFRRMYVRSANFNVCRTTVLQMLHVRWITSLLSVKESHGRGCLHPTVRCDHAASHRLEARRLDTLHLEVAPDTRSVQPRTGEAVQQPAAAGGNGPCAVHDQRSHPPCFVGSSCRNGARRFCCCSREGRCPSSPCAPCSRCLPRRAALQWTTPYPTWTSRTSPTPVARRSWGTEPPDRKAPARRTTPVWHRTITRRSTTPTTHSRLAYFPYPYTRPRPQVGKDSVLPEVPPADRLGWPLPIQGADLLPVHPRADPEGRVAGTSTCGGCREGGAAQVTFRCVCTPCLSTSTCTYLCVYLFYTYITYIRVHLSLFIYIYIYICEYAASHRLDVLHLKAPPWAPPPPRRPDDGKAQVESPPLRPSLRFGRLDAAISATNQSAKLAIPSTRGRSTARTSPVRSRGKSGWHFDVQRTQRRRRRSTGETLRCVCAPCLSTSTCTYLCVYLFYTYYIRVHLSLFIYIYMRICSLSPTRDQTARRATSQGATLSPPTS